MDKILENVKKEIREISEQGINANNLEVLDKLVDIEKDIYEIKEKEGGLNSMEYGRYMGYEYNSPRGRGYNDGGYGARGNYRDYNDGGYGDGNYYVRGYYRHGSDERMNEHLDRIMEGADAYQYGRERYRGGGNQERMKEGLEKLMYALCVFVESVTDFAETPEEKEIIRKHVQKMKGM